MTKTYRINEVFYSLQGEGLRAGTANVFVRFSGCNLACDVEAGPRSPGGFACDTEFVSGVDLSLEDLYLAIATAQNVAAPEHSHDSWCHWLILTGGEPALQVDKEFCDYFHQRGYKLAIETNGSIELPLRDGFDYKCERGEALGTRVEDFLLDWITVSPKVAEHAVKQRFAHEVKYVRGAGQGIPRPTCQAEHYLLSPAFSGDQIDPRALETCIRLCLENPEWRLSVQRHKTWRVR